MSQAQTITLGNGHTFTAIVSGPWCAITPHQRVWTQEEIDNWKLGEQELDLVARLARKAAR